MPKTSNIQNRHEKRVAQGESAMADGGGQPPAPAGGAPAGGIPQPPIAGQTFSEQSARPAAGPIVGPPPGGGPVLHIPERQPAQLSAETGGSDPARPRQDDAQDELRDARDEIRELKAKITKLQMQVKNREEEVAERDTKIRNLKDEQLTFAQSIEDLSNRNDWLRDENAKRDKELAEAKAQIARDNNLLDRTLSAGEQYAEITETHRITRLQNEKRIMEVEQRILEHLADFTKDLAKLPHLPAAAVEDSDAGDAAGDR